MPKYHFKVIRPENTFEDHEGMTLDNIDAAWEEATIAGGLLVKDLDGDLSPGKSCAIEVQDEFFNTVRVLKISAEGPKR
jgi:hypothetical protein